LLWRKALRAFILMLAGAAAMAWQAAAQDSRLFYNSPAPLRSEPSREEQKVLGLINRARLGAGLAPLAWDGLLGQVAREHSADMVRHKYFAYESPTLGSITYRLHRAGCSAPSVRQVICQVGALEDVLKQLNEARHPFHLEPDTHIGIGVYSTWLPPLHTVTLLAVQRLSEVASFPMLAEPGETRRLEWRLAVGLGDPRVVISPPQGVVYDVPVVTRASGGYSAVISFDRGAGKYVIQLGATGAQGPVITDVMYVYVGVPYPPPVATVDATPEGEGNPETIILARLNAERMNSGLRPLRLDARLSAVARAHSRDMAEHHFFAHVSPRTGDLDERLKRAGIRLKSSAENLSQGRSAVEAVAGLMNSPAHRRHILNPEFEQVGIGIARDDDGVLYVTQVFGQESPTVDVQLAAKSLLHRLNAARADRGIAPLARDAVLDEIAAANSRAMAGEDKLGTAQAKQLLDQKSIRFRGCQVLVMVSTDAPGAEHFTPALEGQFSAIGIGLVRGDSRTLGPGMLWTTLILLQR